jgi:hypothetical protein
VHYRLSSDILIKTENAAKPEKQSSSYLCYLISNLDPVSCSFDYGCGKLRYKEVILRTTDTLALVDSAVQLARKQTICGESTTVRKMVQRSNRVSAYSTTEFARLPTTFDRGFCINVLSVIPFYAIRWRGLLLIRKKLRPAGTCLFVLQYRNSDFSRMRGMPNARPWRDGFLIDSLRGFSFYGLTSPDRLASIVLSAGFEIVERTLNEGSVYLLARSPGTFGLPRIMAIDEEHNFRLSTRS